LAKHSDITTVYETPMYSNLSISIASEWSRTRKLSGGHKRHFLTASKLVSEQCYQLTGVFRRWKSRHLQQKYIWSL